MSRPTSSFPTEDVFPRLLCCDMRCSQTCRWRSHACCWSSQACYQCNQVLPGAPKVQSWAPKYSHTYHNICDGISVPVIIAPSYSEGRPELPPRVWYSPEIDASKFTLHILSDSPGGYQWLKYIMLMWWWLLRYCRHGQADCDFWRFISVRGNLCTNWAKYQLFSSSFNKLRDMKILRTCGRVVQVIPTFKIPH